MARILGEAFGNVGLQDHAVWFECCAEIAPLAGRRGEPLPALFYWKFNNFD